ncbi:conserved hypothetical protein [Ricinus communis]|uniref:RNase H type-1 domain-containing protein n=1 Tax=Ricinus communis TaxID=3988 RepID=B9RYP9_RICCO|nr:conserved hypothetical protein [Ricinus communis]
MTVHQILAYHQEIEKANITNGGLNHNTTVRTPVSLCWNPPPSSFFKLNTDGVVHQSSGHGYVGGLIRDTNGRWVAGFSINISLCSITCAELWGVYQGLMLANRLGIVNLMVEVDSMAVTTFAERMSTTVKHIYRETNRAADRLAAFAVNLSRGVHTLQQAPLELVPWLLHDIVGVSYNRRVTVFVS